ncbi:unnamed protein product [Ilex paraguariensis]|uniref:Uncharacterized protein n=1 Tax=Ilex paraguariensis TaxID=185542 RepID=A0ABC8RV25_9AQUA
MQLLSLMPTCKFRAYSLSAKGNMKRGEGQSPVGERQKQVRFLKSWASPLMAALVALSPVLNPPGTHLSVSFYSSPPKIQMPLIFRQNTGMPFGTLPNVYYMLIPHAILFN